MLLLIITMVIVMAGVGVILKNIFQHRITTLEFWISMLIQSIVIIPLTIYGGWKLSNHSQLSFDEFRNGWESAAIVERTTCVRDGSCYWTYDCDPYYVTETYSCGKDNKETCTRQVKKYHSCPYCKYETYYGVNTTLGQITIARSVLPENPNENRYRSSVSIPNDIIKRAGSGIPPFWQNVKNRIDSGVPGPVTKKFSYINYIAPSKHSVFASYQNKIDTYLSDSLLPILQSDIYSFYHATKVYSVGVRVPKGLWNTRLEYFNAQLGNTLQGDLHIVFVSTEKINNIDEYALVLEAYWKSKQYLNDNVLSKNAIVVLFYVNEQNVIIKTKSFTGMPTGNERMIVALNKISNISVNVDSVMGQTLVNRNFDNIQSGGVLYSIIQGSDTKFDRSPMTTFQYLKTEISPLTSHLLLIIFITIVLSSIAWIVAIHNPILSHSYYNVRIKTRGRTS